MIQKELHLKIPRKDDGQELYITFFPPSIQSVDEITYLSMVDCQLNDLCHAIRIFFFFFFFFFLLFTGIMLTHNINNNNNNK